MDGEYNSINGANNKNITNDYPMGMDVVVHKVVLPPPQSTVDKLKGKLKETFFPDDPFRSFKGQPTRQKWLLTAKYLFPILDWAPHYSLSLFKSDLVAGLTIASLAIPQVIIN
jgi:sulfate transporter 3